MPCVCWSHWQIFFDFVPFILCQMALKVLYSPDLLWPTAPEAYTPQHLSHLSAHLSLWQTHTQSYTLFTSYTASPPYSSNSHISRLIQASVTSSCTAFWETQCLLTVEQTCSLQRNILDTHIHTNTLPCTCNKQQQKVILLIFASDYRGSQSRERCVVKLTCNHNATPCVFWRSNMIGSVARGGSSVLICNLIYFNQSYRWMFPLDLFRSNTLVPLNIPIRCKIHFAGSKQSR